MSTGISLGGEFLAPWRNVTGLQPDGEVTYYTAALKRGCVPCTTASPELSRHVIHQSDIQLTYADAPDNSVLAGKCILLVVNPKSGTGAASMVKSNVDAVSSILSEAGLEPVVRYTEKPRHAIEILIDYGKEELSKFAAIVSVGGDGTLHEVTNGLIQAYGSKTSSTTDWAEAPPIAVLPGGSGNAIAVSMGVTSAQHAGLNIVHSLRTGSARPLAVMQYRRLTESAREMLSIGGIQWGLPADVDKGTEYLRFMGDARYDIGAVLHIARKRSAHARIRVTVDPEQNARANSLIENGRKRHMQQHKSTSANYAEQVGDNTYLMDTDFVMGVAWNSSKIADGFMLTPHANVTETGVFDLIVVRADISRGEMLAILLNVEDGSFMNKTEQYLYFKATRVEFEAVEGPFLTLDGEDVAVEPFVLEMAPEDGKIRILDSFSDVPPSTTTFM